MFVAGKTRVGKGKIDSDHPLQSGTDPTTRAINEDIFVEL